MQLMQQDAMDVKLVVLDACDGHCLESRAAICVFVLLCFFLHHVKELLLYCFAKPNVCQAPQSPAKSHTPNKSTTVAKQSKKQYAEWWSSWKDFLHAKLRAGSTPGPPPVS